MNLIIDRGNTLVKWALFEGSALRFMYRSEELSDDVLESIFKLYDIENCISSSVADVSFSASILNEKTNYIQLDHQTKVPFENLYETPSTLGRDRIAAVAGALAEFPERDLVVIDTGTCLTIDFVTKKREYLGGNISPGPHLRLKAMHEWTASLPLVQAADEIKLFGTTTETALQHGGYGGCIAEIIGWMARAREQFPDPIVVLSGGDAESFATSIKNEIFVRPDLILQGLNVILDFNVNKP